MTAPALVLPFALEAQQGHLQCWAAVAVSLRRFYGMAPVPAQQDFARSLLGERNDHACAPLVALAHAGLAYAETARALAPGALRAQLARGHPVPAAMRHFIGWHLVVLHGIDADGKVWVADPLYGPSVVPYRIVVQAYRDHYAWSHSYCHDAARGTAQNLARSPAQRPAQGAGGRQAME